METRATYDAGAEGAGRTLDWVVLGGLVALTLIAWMLKHGYEGITHDAQLYSFQAMARLKPALLGNDLYLRFGSQDNYTVFSPLYAAAIARFGFEPAAALITLASQFAFITAAWFLARRVMPGYLAWLAVGLVVALPGVYGAQGIWNYMEGFVTPRLSCEALVLAAIAATLAGRDRLTIACLIAGTLLHPLMAAGGIAFVVCIRLAPMPSVVIRRLLMVGAGAAVLGVAAISSISSLRLNGEWLDLVRQRQGFLFLNLWHVQDWARVAVHFTALIVGFIVLPKRSQARLLCSSGVLVALCGLALSWVCGDLLNISLFIQVQVWRWTWLAAVMSALLAPAIATHCWKNGLLGRLAFVLMIVAWLAIDEPYTIVAGPLAIAAAIVATGRKTPSARVQRMLLAGGVAMLGIVVIRSIANAALAQSALPDQTPVPELVRQIRGYSRDGLIPCAVVAGVWWLLACYRNQVSRVLVSAMCAVGCLALVPASAGEWQMRQFPQSDFDAFASWRRHIPPGEEVFWIDGSVTTWALLERPRYLTNNQMASILFAQGAREELRRRALRLAPLAEKQPYIFWDQDRSLIRKGTPLTLEALCAAIDARFIVSREDLAATPLEGTPSGSSLPYRGLKLFQCAR
jgi:hypothetical protein